MYRNAYGNVSAYDRLFKTFELSEERSSFLRKVYTIFLLGLGIAGATGLLVSGSNKVLSVVQNHYFLFFILEIGLLILAYVVRRRSPVNLLVMAMFCVSSGVTFGPILAFYFAVNPSIIASSFFLTSGIFAGLTVYVFVSRKDFSFLRGILFVGLLIAIGASILGFFINLPMFHVVLSAGIALLFCGYILFDTSNLLFHYETDEYIAGALALYLDFINLFLAILRILGFASSDD